jgi:DNA polymerase-3 subunit gamma/tau
MAKSLAVKYRPTSWDDLLEQDAVKIILKQQLESGSIHSAMLFCGPSGDGKTTTARIFANALNKGKGTPIEMDAASHNGVDDVREISKLASTKTIDGSEYKVFIIDECLTGDVELLTDSGFKRFDSLTGTELVAQYDNGNIEFVKPIEFIKQHYADDLVCWSPRNWCNVRMTKHHIQPLHYVKSDKVKENYIQNVKFNQKNELIVSGRGCGIDNTFTAIDRLVIACQADGVFQNTNSEGTRWTIQIKKQRKVDRLLSLFAEADIKWSEIKSTRPDDLDVRRFGFTLPSKNVSKLFSSYFDLTQMGYYRAQQFIYELQFWDGSDCGNYIYYGSTVKENTDFVSAVAPLAGYSARQTIKPDNRSENYSDIHAVRLYKTQYSNCQHIGKTVRYEKYDGDVYCVRVPSHQIVIRSEGFVFITGNCHSMTANAWQAMLKLIEEPPAKVVFIFCTTDPQRLPATILSRVQRFQFQKVSTKGIADRLTEIVIRENSKDYDDPDLRDIGCIRHDSDAIEYIAKLADGGMRLAIQYLEKCLAYSNELTVKNVVKALNVTNYNDYTHLTDLIITNNKSEQIKFLDEIYASGVDFKQFLKQYVQVILDVNKTLILDDLDEAFKYISLPKTNEIETWLTERLQDGNIDLFNRLLSHLIKIDSEVKYSQNAKCDIECGILLFEV